jgi:hypothetical protein
MGWGECVKATWGRKLKTVLCRISLSQVVGSVGFVCIVIRCLECIVVFVVGTLDHNYV